MTKPVVVGAGPLGLIAALALSEKVGDVTLVGPKARKDGRTTALLGEAVELLNALGVWQLLDGKTAPLKTMRIVDGAKRLIRAPEAAFHAHELKIDSFGHNVKNADLLEALEAAVRANDGVKHLPLAVQEVKLSGNGASQLVLSDGSTLDAGLIVAADGRSSLIREAAGIETKNWSYPQTALVMNLSHTRDHDNISTEFHTESGPFTQVPLPGRQSSLVWVENPETAEHLKGLSKEELAEQISKKSHYLLGDITVESEPMAYPLSGLIAKTFGSGPVVLVGESAHVFPPIGAQGMNLGIRDVKALMTSVSRHKAHSDPDLEGLSKAYSNARAMDVQLRTSAVDALNRSLLSGLLPTQLGRGLGLHALNKIPSLRKFLMKQGLGARVG